MNETGNYKKTVEYKCNTEKCTLACAHNILEETKIQSKKKIVLPKQWRLVRVCERACKRADV